MSKFEYDDWICLCRLAGMNIESKYEGCLVERANALSDCAYSKHDVELHWTLGNYICQTILDTLKFSNVMKEGITLIKFTTDKSCLLATTRYIYW